jgi:hypothetical protein
MSEDNGLRFAEYYKLSFYGKGVPVIFLGKEFIFRGLWPKDLMMKRKILGR